MWMSVHQKTIPKSRAKRPKAPIPTSQRFDCQHGMMYPGSVVVSSHFP